MAKRKKDEYQWSDFIDDVLNDATTPLSSREIWEKGREQKFDEKMIYRGLTPERTINSLLSTSVRSELDSKYEIYGSRPIKYYLKEKKNIDLEPSDTGEQTNEDLENDSSENKPEKFNERDLHPLLSYFVYTDPTFKATTKTILHEKSGKKKQGVNKWIHPDIVGVSFPFTEKKKTEEERVVIELQKNLCRSSVLLYSFELKKEIDFPHLREYFFQAVSNSSWANKGYLVAHTICKDVEFEEELRRLSNVFGIGVIELNPDSPADSVIFNEAKYNDQLDWGMIKLLCGENDDFSQFIGEVSNSINNAKNHMESADRKMKEDEMKEYIKLKNILKI